MTTIHQPARRPAWGSFDLFLALALALPAAGAFAQQGAADRAAAATASAATPRPWTYQTPKLSRAEVDRLLSQPEKLLVLDVRRPDEIVAKGSFPAYLNIQTKEVEKLSAYIPRDRAVLTVSNHAYRAGAVGDQLRQQGFTVAGATGSEDYEAEGGKAVVRIVAPPPRQAAAGPLGNAGTVAR